MKKANIMIVAAMVISAPAFAQQQTISVDPAPVADRPNTKPDGPNWKAINRKLNARAKNAVNNGARPKVVRQKVTVYKHKLHRRWNASQ